MHGVGLVRGINVGPTTRVAKQQLVDAFEEAGLVDVRTFLASGNIVFDADRAPGESERRAVEAGIEARSGVAARVLLITEQEFRRIADANPLLDAGDDFSKLVVTFVGADLPDGVKVPPSDELAPELVRLGTRAVYQWCPLGVSKSKLPASFWKSVGEVATGRNWRTVLKLLEELDTRN
ncbi:DUF1697 domain-containing protein [Leifsonia poae]|uniref:DUF1697 domain-containing protein n=1 Tax=Leifsonia poae TaxID=110933 RepID=A0A9W6HCL1_9MICO|nr:DUF1697 domain-containing protein [Leifsonia poae]GLJ77827.1 hypothetical protein GCM10017584_34010 [Leifsonia poae]